METRKLGFTDLNLTPIGLGTWAIGGGNNPYGWGPQDDQESIDTILQALDLGINWLDTAKGYGHGHSEEIIGKAVRARRGQVTIATKCGILWKEDGSDIFVHLKAESIKAECESSLKRLQTDTIDLYQIHWPSGDDTLEEGWGAIADLIKEGKVRYGGVSNFTVDQLKRIQPIHPVASLQPPYNLLKRTVEKDVLEYCLQEKIGVIVYSPMQAGLLSGRFTAARAAALPRDDWRKGSPDFQAPLIDIHLDLVEKLRPLASRKMQSVANLAIAWTLSHPAVTGAIVGARHPQQICETAAAAELKLDENDLREIGELLALHDFEVQKLS